jgi:hypothetical protein
LSPEVRQLLESAPWPGNLIQLQSVLSSLLLSNNDDITVDHLQAILGDLRDTSAPDRPALPPEFFELPLREAREAFERIYFENLLGRESSNMSRVADKAGLERTHLYRKLKQLNIRFRAAFRPNSASLPQISIKEMALLTECQAVSCHREAGFCFWSRFLSGPPPSMPLPCSSAA